MNLKDCALETTMRTTVLVSRFRCEDADNFLAAKVYARPRWDLFDDVRPSCKM